MSRRAKAVLGALITLLLLWWVLRDVSPAEVLGEVRMADPWLLAAMVATATFGFVLRAWRWKVLLEPEHPGADFEARFGATCAGFAANNLFPARVGEIVRAYVLARVAVIPFGGSVGSLVVERILDGLVLLSLLLAALALPGFPLGTADTAEFVRRVATAGGVVFVVGFVLLWLAARRPETALRIWQRTVGRLVPSRFAPRVDGLFETFVRGLGALRGGGVLLRAVAWSYAVWLWLGASFWLGLLAFDVTEPGFSGALFLQSVIGFSVAVPSTPGFFGVFEAGARIGLSPWDLPEATIVGFAVSYHILTFIPVTVLGLLYLQRVGLQWSDVGAGRKAVAE